MLSLGFVLAQLTKSFVEDVIEERVEKESRYLSDLVDEASNVNELRNLSKELDLGMIYVTNNYQVLLNTTSEVLHLSEEDSKTVQSFIIDNQGEATQYQKGYLRDQLFFFPFQTESKKLDGSLIIVLKVDSLKNITSNIWLLITITVIIGIFIMATLGRNIFEKYIKPIRSAASVADELAQGNYKARTYEGNFGEAAQLTTSINVLARNLQEMTMQQEMQKDRLEAVINNMGNGLVLIDDKGYIHLVNRAFLESFGGTSIDYLGVSYLKAIKEKEIHDAIREVFMTENKVRSSFILPLQIERRFLEVLGAPIINDEEEWKGVVLVFHDITELKNLEQTRKDFVANVSHELKTPITSIRGFSETLLEGAMEDEALRKQFINIILNESQRLQSLIHDLLELSKLEKEEFKLNVEQISLKKLLEDTVMIVDQQAEEKQINIHQNYQEDVQMEGDSARLKQVFINLITNAISYTPSEGEVSISFHEEKGNVNIVIADSGIGIPEEDVPRIFERFYRVDKARSRNSGGTGLGLAIVKHIVEAHHGTINVKSIYQQGTTFSISLPKKFTKN